MGLPDQFNDIIKKHLNVFAAWMPIVNNYRLGDYGIIADGVFAKLGNITDDFKVSVTEGSGEAASIDFTSEGASIIKLAGGVAVDVIPAGEVNANVEIGFSKEKSFLVKAPTITVAAIDNVNEVAIKLKDTGKWDGKWKVVHQVYTAIDPVIVITHEAGTKLNFSGDASALGQMKLGSLGVNIDSNKSLGLKINGKNGVIGLGLFKLKSKIFGGFKVDVLGEDPEEEGQNAPIFLAPDDITKDDL